MKEPTFDEDGYPTQETLETIMDWPITVADNSAVQALMEYCKAVWNTYGSWAYESGVTDYGKEWIEISTGGWGGNEEIIEAMQENVMFWGLCWLESRRGGHYKFITNPISE